MTPRSDSGFYAHQRYCLTALIAPNSTPEAARRTVDASYALALERLAGLTHFFARETHVKQLELLEASTFQRPSATVMLPGLTVEPIPCFYRLTASAFRFLREVVVRGWGDAALHTSQVRPDGPSGYTIDEGLADVIAIADAAAELSTRELEGAAFGPSIGTLRTRLRALRQDEDAIGDARAMIPVSTVHPKSGTFLALVFVGWEKAWLDVSLTHMKGERKSTVFEPERHVLPVPVLREVAIRPDELLGKDALRAACAR